MQYRSSVGSPPFVRRSPSSSEWLDLIPDPSWESVALGARSLVVPADDGAASDLGLVHLCARHFGFNGSAVRHTVGDENVDRQRIRIGMKTKKAKTITTKSIFNLQAKATAASAVAATHLDDRAYWRATREAKGSH